MELGDLIISKDTQDEFGLPIFIWEIITSGKTIQCIINSPRGLTKAQVQNKFPKEELRLANHAKFQILTPTELHLSFDLKNNGFMFETHNHVSSVIKNSKPLAGGYKALNMVYGMSYIVYIGS